jgi:hypothetical protein
LFMIDNRMHMAVWGKYPSTRMDFDRIE